jgi:hypothetical protein
MFISQSLCGSWFMVQAGVRFMSVTFTKCDVDIFKLTFCPATFCDSTLCDVRIVLRYVL